MTMKITKKLQLVIIATLVFLIVAFSYPYGKELVGMLHTYSRPATHGKEVMYSYIDEGDIRIADEILQNKYELSRFQPVNIDKITWQEDPFADIYWRFNFYNLEPVRNLLYAWEETGKPVYKNKLIEITNSFIDNGMNGQYSWDYHGAAFRTMTLIDLREKLKEKNELPADLDNKIQASLKLHGDFLADPAHFEKEYNHGLDQAAALYLLAINYPNMDGAKNWLKISSERMVSVLSGIIDDDGVLVENSPYYHLYVLEKLFEINKYLKQNNLSIDGFSDEKLDKMVTYVTYMLQPDLNVPTIGASIKRQVGLSGIYKEIAVYRPDLLYVLSQGVYGLKPSKLNIQFPNSGETIMRSGWGRKDSYINQTQLIFDTGNYRTNHSDLDALSFNLYGNGIALMPDAGLFSYQPGPYRSYFHGTRSHNTVVVDGKDQNVGSALTNNTVTHGFFKEDSGYVYQSGQSTLYEGVTHERAISMIEGSTILIIDKLKSSSEHTYEQMFHLFPGAKVNSDGLTLTATGSQPGQSLSIKQFITDNVDLHTTKGNHNPPDGLCSFELNKAIPCTAVSYAQKGKDVSYVTAISIGESKADISYDKANNSITVGTLKGSYKIKINETGNIKRDIEANKKYDSAESNSDPRPTDPLNMLSGWKSPNIREIGFNGGSVSVEVNKKYYQAEVNSSNESIDSLNMLSGWKSIYQKGAGPSEGSVFEGEEERSLKVVTPSDGSYVEIFKKTNLDLSEQNIYFKIKTKNSSSIEGVDVSLSNNNWKEDARYNMDESFNYRYVNREDEWLQFGVGKSDLRKSDLGGWVKNSPNFDWSKVDGVKIAVRSKEGSQSIINIKDFILVPDQREARAVIIFDDGWSSVMDAASKMNEYGMKGNTAIITNSVGKRSYLTLDDIKKLQNNFGWNIANHSNLHKNAVDEYELPGNLSGLENDVCDAIQYMIQNNINSAPNWYIYPDGSTDGAVKKIIGKYYKFARATSTEGSIFPYAEPLEVGVFPVYSDRVTPDDVHTAISEAIQHHQTIFLMFHKISKGDPTVFTEISMNDFETILKDINNQGIKVDTLSELDRENNVTETEFTLHPAVPSQISLDFSSSYLPLNFNFVLNKIWESLINFGKKLNQIIKVAKL